MDRRASGLVLILAGTGLIYWYHSLARVKREVLFSRMTGGQS